MRHVNSYGWVPPMATLKDKANVWATDNAKIQWRIEKSETTHMQAGTETDAFSLKVNRPAVQIKPLIREQIRGQYESRTRSRKIFQETS
jgi:hypothetical protein